MLITQKHITKTPSYNYRETNWDLFRSTPTNFNAPRNNKKKSLQNETKTRCKKMVEQQPKSDEAKTQ